MGLIQKSTKLRGRIKGWPARAVKGPGLLTRVHVCDEIVSLRACHVHSKSQNLVILVPSILSGPPVPLKSLSSALSFRTGRHGEIPWDVDRSLP
jgi:hypothetical protein